MAPALIGTLSSEYTNEMFSIGVLVGAVICVILLSLLICGESEAKKAAAREKKEAAQALMNVKAEIEQQAKEGILDGKKGIMDVKKGIVDGKKGIADGKKGIIVGKKGIVEGKKGIDVKQGEVLPKVVKQNRQQNEEIYKGEPDGPSAHMPPLSATDYYTNKQW